MLLMEESRSGDGWAAEAISNVASRLEEAEPLNDSARLELLEELYKELERELDRDFGEAPSARR